MPMQFSSSWDQSAIDRLQTIYGWFFVVVVVLCILGLYERLFPEFYFKRRLRTLGIDEYVLYGCQAALVEETVE